MRPWAPILCTALAACTSGAVTVPSDQIFYEVPQQGAALPVPAVDPFTGRIEQVLADPADGGTLDPLSATAAADPTFGAGSTAPISASGVGAVPSGVSPTPLDDDRLNLNLYTLDQQRIDAAIAERELEEARRQLVIVQPGEVPQAVEGANIALYAAQTSNAVGERRFSRGTMALGGGNCRRFSTPDQAQRVFLSNGGPERDPYNVDPDGDGFACDWNPEPFRRIGR